MHRTTRTKLLEAAPWLGAGLASDELRIARERVLTDVLEVRPGAWRPSADSDPAFGALVLDGLLARNVTLGEGESRGLELIGPDDLIRPWGFRGESGTVPAHEDWRALAPSRLAILDEGFVDGVRTWPQLAINLLEASLDRSRSLSYLLAARQTGRLDRRILVLLWHLADRWGKVTPAGVVVDLPGLTHERIAAMIAARRPSVTLAIGHLRELGMIEQATSRWTLRGSPADLRSILGTPRSVAGEAELAGPPRNSEASA